MCASEEMERTSPFQHCRIVVNWDGNWYISFIDFETMRLMIRLVFECDEWKQYHEGRPPCRIDLLWRVKWGCLFEWRKRCRRVGWRLDVDIGGNCTMSWIWEIEGEQTLDSTRDKAQILQIRWPSSTLWRPRLWRKVNWSMQQLPSSTKYSK